MAQQTEPLNDAPLISIVDSHHKVLTAWANYRKGLSKAPRLITLDHHTDTSPPFRKFIKENFDKKSFERVQTQYIESIDFSKPETVALAVKRLNNDEHIVTAIKSDVLSSSFVIAHNAANTDLETYKAHKIACRNILDHNTVLESEVLNKCIESFDEILKESSEASILQTPYILDIDLDYFNTFKSVSPDNDNTFKNLIANAGLITIATEPEYVRGCALDKDLSSDFLLKSLTKKFLIQHLTKSLF